MDQFVRDRGDAREDSAPRALRRVSRARDADEHALNLSQWDQRYDQLSAGAFEGEVMELWLPKSQIFVERANRQLRQSCAAWKDSVWFGIPAAEDGMMWMGSKPLAADAVCVRDGGVEFDLLTAPDFDLYGIVVDRPAFASHLEETARLDLDRVLQQRDVISLVPARKHRLCAALSNILLDAEAAGDDPALLQARVFDVLVEVLQQGKASAPVARRCVSARQQIVSRIRSQVLASPGEAPSIPDLCRDLHVSRRTLQNSVEEVTGQSPLSFIRSLRLNEVRRALKQDRRSAISAVAYSWGFTHLSQFAKDYRQLFGELPSEARQEH
ncbi:helix-turn-helix domain-containing protein [Uliginosibacterium sp. TH139]|uniref:helix-turn-helix domain-containing protein n=1 Tax=Uliginosibacterium sp. TH139 TaxID=2067453 RepID=UPI000C7A038F|nr:helix-turn-helix domain-containing protein [Uliginosibacterium sp. TH139]PLK49864.1 AraC family transcriptional regulator [Uliginosibacterium sp. TH139]